MDIAMPCEVCGSMRVRVEGELLICPSCHSTWIQTAGVATPPRSPQERNAPCRCGSGRKLKRCCALRGQNADLIAGLLRFIESGGES